MLTDITVIGGINIDIEGSPFAELRREDSNPGTVTMAFGGVGRNITENLARMGGKVAMISVIGDDHMGIGAREHLRSLGVDVSLIQSVKGRNSAMYLSILNHDNDMELAICDMDIISHITPDLIEKNRNVLEKSKVIALDGNLEEETIRYVTDRFFSVPLFLDPVSAAKAVKAKDVIGKFACIKPNVMEAEILSGMEIRSENDLKRAGQWFIDQGVGRLFVTLNKDGVYYKDRHCEGFIRPGHVKISSATGAGDSFSAAILLGLEEDMDTRDIARYGMAASAIAMESSSAVNQNMSKDEIERRLADV
ncbi:MAG TPA: carbohydrate kinase family protein [Candidatus Fimisoma avicola]|uniref:Carbohydrate kinase family protein n=1 Tax=Candidatus Fimisoma avicola TaxID=2840826 RepID=A0A9D1I5P3_9FIRM|nr:carbohydrate kinase family protein [Candidatus Fimisoma avicola]